MEIAPRRWHTHKQKIPVIIVIIIIKTNAFSTKRNRQSHQVRFVCLALTTFKLTKKTLEEKKAKSDISFYSLFTIGRKIKQFLQLARLIFSVNDVFKGIFCFFSVTHECCNVLTENKVEQICCCDYYYDDLFWSERSIERSMQTPDIWKYCHICVFLLQSKIRNLYIALQNCPSFLSVLANNTKTPNTHTIHTKPH